MARNYAKGIPVGDNGNPFFLSPPEVKAIEQYVGENGTASSVITLTDQTSAVEVAAGAATVVIRWVPRTETAGVSPFGSVIAIAGTTANYDHVVPANTVRRFVVPQEVTPSQGTSSMVGDNTAYGLFQRMAVKTQGIGSVLTSEYGKSNS